MNPVVQAAASVPGVHDYLRPGTLRLNGLPPLSLYVHFPWCVRKCPYCDFNSHEWERGADDLPEQAYLAALRRDLEQSLPLIWGRRIVSVFIGGGTPSLMSPAGLERLLSDVRACLPLQPDCEITLEANPGTAEAGRFAAYRAAGVNRLSVGIQSFNAASLAALGRIHDGRQALAAAELACREFNNVNLDLMYALPGQSEQALQDDIRTAIGFGPSHLSVYQLTLEPNTVFAKYPPPLPDDDTAAAMQVFVEEETGRAGYGQYEVSAYARAGRRCRHNLNYWEFGDYLGIGAGAHSKLSFPQRIVRQVRYRQPQGYLAQMARGDGIAESHEISRRDLPFEFMLNALRLHDGFPAGLFVERTGLPPGAVDAALRKAEAKGLLVADLQRVAPTPLGRRFLNDLQQMFLAD
jgi:oxygen-independent coproporphyrinogen-3 oxidase